ncbi:MAG: FecR family protein [Bacteroidota bacterium]
MNKEYVNNKYYELAAKYLSGEMSDKEVNAFLHDIENNSELQHELFLLDKHWNNPGSEIVAKTDMPDAEQSWSSLKQRILNNEGGLSKKINSNKKPQSLSIFVAKIAASILLIVFIGFAAYLQFEKLNEKDLLSLSTGSENTTLIQSLDDGSVVYLADNTNFKYPKHFAKDERKVNLSGEAFFEVTQNKEQKFRVETRQAMIEVVGTSFNVKNIEENHTEIYVETGRVIVKMIDNPKLSQEVSQGELLTILDNKFGGIINTNTYNTAWRKNRMQFKDESLHKILKVLGQNYEIDFLIEDETLKDRKLTLTIDDAKPLLLGELIASSLNCSYRQTEDNSIVFFNKNP